MVSELTPYFCPLHERYSMEDFKTLLMGIEFCLCEDKVKKRKQWPSRSAKVKGIIFCIDNEIQSSTITTKLLKLNILLNNHTKI